MKAKRDGQYKMEKASFPAQWMRIYALYRRAFPVSERKPFWMILKMRRRGKSDVWYVCRGRKFAGFAVTINGENLVLLDYLAVESGMRGKGIGSYILQAMKEHYSAAGLFVEIESAYEDVPDRQERVRRKEFYTRNEMKPSRVMADVFGVKMELLCWNCDVDFKTYHSFYAENYSLWAASHITEAEYPE